MLALAAAALCGFAAGPASARGAALGQQEPSRLAAAEQTSDHAEVAVRPVDDAELASDLERWLQALVADPQAPQGRLAAHGAAAARAALARLQERPLEHHAWSALRADQVSHLRLALAQLAREHAGAENAGAACDALAAELERAYAAQPSAPALRLVLIELLGSPRLAAHGAPRAGIEQIDTQRATTLERVVLLDPQRECKAAAVASLALFDSAQAARALERLLWQVSQRDQAQLARALATHPAARERVCALVRELFLQDAPNLGAPAPRGARTRIGEEALAELLGLGYGFALAEIPSGGMVDEDLVPLLLATRHPSPAVQEGGRAALEGFLARAQFLGQEQRALAVLERLGGCGLDDLELLEMAARLALVAGVEPSTALARAKELEQAALARAGLQARVALSGALLFQAAAWTAMGRASQMLPGAAMPATGEAADQGLSTLLERARAVLDELAGARLELAASGAGRQGASWLERRAQVELYAALAWLDGMPQDSALALERAKAFGRAKECARAAHRWSLEAQLASLADSTDKSNLPSVQSFGDLISGPFSPFELALGRARQAERGNARSLDLALALGRAMASVAPGELPGFESDVAFANQGGSGFEPAGDATRRGLLESIARTELEVLDSQIAEIESKLERPDVIELAGGDVARSLEVSSDLAQELDILRSWRMFLASLQSDLASEQEPSENGAQSSRALPRGLARLRSPAPLALELAAWLREQGRAREALELAQRASRDADDTSIGELWRGSPDGTLFVARAESAVGSAWMDLNEPKQAQEVLLRALDRVELLGRELQERGVGPRVETRLRAEQSSLLVALAVNANVKLKDSARALEYFERAWALRQDDFLRVLLACYRARAGRTAEARAILQGMPESPGNFYNLACTWALLGDLDLALEYLRREFEQLGSSSGVLQRQQAWAAGDPDLAALHGDARFWELLGEAGAAAAQSAADESK